MKRIIPIKQILNEMLSPESKLSLINGGNAFWHDNAIAGKFLAHELALNKNKLAFAQTGKSHLNQAKLTPEDLLRTQYDMNIVSRIMK